MNLLLNDTDFNELDTSIHSSCDGMFFLRHLLYAKLIDKGWTKN